MKMPTAVVRHRVQWRPGDPVSFPLGEGSLSSEERLPVVGTTVNGHSSDTRPPEGGREEGEEEEEEGEEEVVVTSSTLPSGGGERTKRFPILGPTRQETELYFRCRRSTRHRIRTQASRPLVTRSADRVVPADCNSVTLTYTSIIPIHDSATTTTITTTTTTTTNTTTSTNAAATTGTITTNRTITSGNSHRSFRHVDSDQHGAVRSSVETSRSGTLPSFDRGSSSRAVSSSLPGFERTANSQATSLPAFERTGSSSAVPRTAFPAFDRSQSVHASGSGGSDQVRSGGVKRSEIPIKFLSESGQIRASELTHRVLKTPSQSQKEHQQQQHQLQKTLQPSKYGFHRRSKSPTFKRLVAVVEKLQTVATDSDSDSHNSDKCRVCATAKTTASGVRFPAVPGISDVAVDGEDGGEPMEASDEELMHLQPHEFLTSLPYTTSRPQPNGGAKKNRHNSVSNSKRHSFNTSSRKGLPNSSDARDDLDPDLTNGWGAWEVDSLSVDSGVDPVKMTGTLGLAPADAHTELHLFLPRLADTASEDSGSVAKASPDPYQPRLPAENPTSGFLHRGKTAPHIHPRTPHRPPQHPHLNPQSQHQGWTGSGERNGRSQTKRYTSPVRAAKRDRTPKRRAVVEVYESYEPFLKGEHLKEKLDDFPTLISLDQD